MSCGGGRPFMPFPVPMPPISPPEEPRQSGKDILKMRLAQGEITLQEYHEMLSVLEGRPVSHPQTRKSHIRMP